MRRQTIWVLVALVLSTSCSFHPSPTRLRVEIKPVQTTRSAPAAASGFTCYGLNITGPGIVPATPDVSCAPPSALVPPPGVIAGLVPSTGGTLEAFVPAGPSRTVQVFGIMSTGGCPTIKNVQQDLASYSGVMEDAVEVGRTTVDLSEETTLSIQSNYVQGSSPNMFCSMAATSGLDLEVPIELLDVSIANDIAATVFDRTKTSFDSTAYDGVVGYYFDIVAKNTSGAAINIGLIEGASTTAATITVPASATSPERMRVALTTPPMGPTYYRVKIGGHASPEMLQVSAARLLVRQENATKTRLFFPLAGATGNAGLSGLSNPFLEIDSTGSSTYTQFDPGYYSRWQKDPGAWATLSGANPWTLEAVLQASGGGTAVVALHNTTSGLAVAGSAASTASSSPALASQSFPDNEPEFGNSYEFEAKIRIDGGSNASLLKVGLWVSLENLSRAQVHYRLARRHLTASAVQLADYQKLFFDLSLYSNPNAIFEFVGGGMPAADTVDLIQCGGVSGCTTPTSIQSILDASSGKTRNRAAVPFGAGYSSNMQARMNVASAGRDLTDARLIIDTEP